MRRLERSIGSIGRFQKTAQGRTYRGPYQGISYGHTPSAPPRPATTAVSVHRSQTDRYPTTQTTMFDATRTPGFPKNADAFIVMRGRLSQDGEILTPGDEIPREYARQQWGTGEGFSRILPVSIDDDADGLPVASPVTPPGGWAPPADDRPSQDLVDEESRLSQAAEHAADLYTLELRRRATAPDAADENRAQTTN